MPRPAWSSSSLPATSSSRNGPSSTFAFAPATTWPCGRSCWFSVRRMPRRRRKRPFLFFNGPDKPPPSSFSAFDAGATGEQTTIDRPRGTVRIPACPRHATDLLCGGHRLSPADRPQRSAGIDRHHVRPIAGADGRAAGPDSGGVGPRAATPARRPQPGPHAGDPAPRDRRAWNRPTSIACRPRSSTSARSCGA